MDSEYKKQQFNELYFKEQREKDNKCEFCGKITKTTSTTFVSHYCKDCHKLVINESKCAIGILKEDEKL